MRRALELALRGRGRVHPNPMVGAVLVRNGRVLAEGHHAFCGGPHAEIDALKKFSTVPADAVLYVTLEPCAHTGKTPPCVDALLAKKVKHVAVGASDVNPLVAGKGIAALRRAGVRVTTGVLAEEAAMLNRDFNHWIRRRMPYVSVKAGQSLDGAIASVSKQSKWITSERSRRAAMELRAHADAILIGVNTVLADDPRLTVRLPGFRSSGPLKIVLDPLLKTPPTAKIFKDGARTLLVASSQARLRSFGANVDILRLPGRSFDWKKLLTLLGKRGIVNLLIEGGGETIGRAFDAGVVHEVHFYVAPFILGGASAVRSVAGKGASLKKTPRFRKVFVETLGGDLHYMGIY